jgi:hypothetical protein
MNLIYSFYENENFQTIMINGNLFVTFTIIVTYFQVVDVTRMAGGIQGGTKTTPEMAIRLFQGRPLAGHRMVGHGGTLRYFRESMDIPSNTSLSPTRLWRTKRVRLTKVNSLGGESHGQADHINR